MTDAGPVAVDVPDPGRTGRIYVVDDEPANGTLLERILARAGHEDVTVFTDGRSLLDAIEVREPDLILLDLRMPPPDGFAVMESLRRDRPQDVYLPILVLTADATRDVRRDALQRGATDFVMKPFDVDEVVLRVRNLLETRRLHESVRRRNLELRGEVVATTLRLSEREDEWAAEAATLARLAAGATLEETAAQITAEVASLPDLDLALIASLDAEGRGVVLGKSAAVDIRAGINRPLPPDVTQRWHAALAGGSAWVGTWDDAFPGSDGPSSLADRPTAAALVPLRTEAGVVGALFVATVQPNGVRRLRARLPILESFGAITTALLGREIRIRHERTGLRDRLERAIATRAFHPVFQPIIDVESGGTVGYEALTRFDDGVRPDRWFSDAETLGLGERLEIASLEAAIGAAPALAGTAFLSVNVSPALVLERGHLERVLASTRRSIVLEVTEHVPIEDYPAFRKARHALTPARRLAVDDAGAGFASFRHIVELRPDFVKIDIALVTAIERDSARQALVAGMVYYAARSHCQLIAEGVETPAELATIRDLGVDLAQGYFIGRPSRAGDIGAGR